MNKNALLLVAVIVMGLACFFVMNNNVSLKGYIKTDGYTPLGKPNKAWENQWEVERAK